MTPSHADFFKGSEIISQYTRADALRDGVLVEVSSLAREAGIRYPVAVTAAVWNGYICPHYLDQLTGQDINGRLWDLLWLFTLAARKSKHTNVIVFEVLFVVVKDASCSHSIAEEDILQETVTLKAVYGPGDEGEPVVTIMLPEED